MFYFEQLRITGPGVNPAILDFKRGLNIIHGPSDTGKSYIIECITYLFGSDSVSIDEDTGYNNIKFRVNYNGKAVSISRKLGSKEILVESQSRDIESGVYKTSGKKDINTVWLKLMGIDEVPAIIKNTNFKTQELTIRTLSHLIAVKEDYIFKKGSILVSEQKTQQTANKSALLFMYDGKDSRDEAEREDPKIKDAKKKAVEEYISDVLKRIGDRKLSMEKYEGPSSTEIRSNIDSILVEIEGAENELSNLVNRSKDNAAELYRVNEELAENEMLLSRYHKLQHHYEADIKRLAFIAEGSKAKLSLAKVDNCPFCGGELEDTEQEVYIDSLKSESEDIVVKAQGLIDTINAVNVDIRSLHNEESILKAERNQIELEINNEVQPRISSLRKLLNDYQVALERAKEHEMIRAGENLLKSDKFKNASIEEDEKKYNVIERFGEDFFHDIEEEMYNILNQCAFDPFGVLEFDKKKFDLVIDGKAKEKYGKGYRAFINTVLVVAVHKYLKTHGSYYPNILILDSPILSLSEKEDVIEPEKKKVALFNYLMSQMFNEQTIILENDIPKMDYSNANMIEFTKDETRGRYGLLDIK